MAKEGRDRMVGFNALKHLVLDWARERGILSEANSLAQANKTLEEVQELIEALEAENAGCDRYINSKGRDVMTHEEIKDAYGDILVTIIIGAETSGFDIVDCLESAYNEIKDRKGKMIDGTY